MNSTALWDLGEFRETPRAPVVPQPTFRGPGVATDFADLIVGRSVAYELPRGGTTDLLETVIAIHRFQRSAQKTQTAASRSTALKKRVTDACAQPLLEDAAEPVHFFVPPKPAVQAFLDAFNGTGLKRLSRRMLGASMAATEAADLLSDVVEDALIATFQYFMSGGETSAVLQLQDEKVLLNALVVRVPRIAADEKHRIASSLLTQLKADLAFGRKLVIDGGTVSMLDGRLRAEVAGAIQASKTEREPPLGGAQPASSGHRDEQEAQAA